ncbi:MAG: phosphopantetheine-binding protein [Candidatus Pedobacter colombiensis]|uniref:Phosphopantetheine-binding protein n=1 Tax=Candidatus Pedobacter colombiensis TaxID=3121371 RepID=A0AAJ6BA28_9SPHI|nr:phosphopantetheine-binding protein [Pedobacter sp.]WEK20838.1 MAG: phosphopantetheine-binding protein [Pedobacter sp.]
MEREELVAKLKEIVAPYTHDKEALTTISPSTDFIKDLKINSANLVDVILDVEEEFDIEIDNLEMARMLNVNATISIIEDKLKALGRE